MLSRYFWSYLCSNIDILKYFQSFRPVIWYYFGTRSLLCPTASRREWRSDSCCGSARCTNFVVLSTVHDTVADGVWPSTTKVLHARGLPAVSCHAYWQLSNKCNWCGALWVASAALRCRCAIYSSVQTLELGDIIHFEFEIS